MPECFHVELLPIIGWELGIQFLVDFLAMLAASQSTKHGQNPATTTTMAEYIYVPSGGNSQVFLESPD
jgi:hypothetical protein